MTVRSPNSTELLRGTLDLLILRTLESQSLHGLGITDRIQQVTDGTFVVPAGSLFPALHRLEEREWVEGKWTTNEEGRRIKTYRLTPAGRRQLSEGKQQWARIVVAMAQVLDSR